MRMIPYGHQSIDRKDIRAVTDVLRGDWLTQGPTIDLFERSLCRYTGATYAVAVTNGTVALHLAYLAAGLQSGDEVITSPLTFVATANAALYIGARVVFADVDAQSGNINPQEIANKISTRTKMIVPVHFGGNPCDLIAIKSLARKRKIIVIEDACHALGASYQANGQSWKIGSCRHSDMAVFSFHPVKPITSAEGGAILTNNKDFYKKLIQLRSHGITRDPAEFLNNSVEAGPWYYEMQALGYNYRITDMQCALGNSQLKKLDHFVGKRRRITQEYHNAWKDSVYFDIPIADKTAVSAWHLFPIRLKGKFARQRKEFFCALRSMGLGVQVHYIPVHVQPYYAKLNYKKGSCPQAEDFYEREISLPLYPAMTNGDIRQVISTVNKAATKILKEGK